MKEIKLSGREIAVLRAIDFATGNFGNEIHERTHIEEDELLGILNGLSDVGYVEGYLPDSPLPIPGLVEPVDLLKTRFEVNPSYALQLREAMKRY